MNAHLCLLFFIVVFHETINALPHYRSRRQINPPQNLDPSHKGRAGWLDNPISGSISGASYYGEYNVCKLIIPVFSFFFSYI
jgi:hypothetical protein